MRTRLLIGLIGFAGVAGAVAMLHGEDAAVQPEGQPMTEHATFAAGCFWGSEAVFQQVHGVVNTTVGYTGGSTQSPTYEQVCSHTTGHTEAIDVTFDPVRVSYEELLE